MSIFLCRRKGASDWDVYQGNAREYGDAAADYARGLVYRDPELARTFLDDGATIEITRAGSRGHRSIHFEMRLEPVFNLKLEKVFDR